MRKNRKGFTLVELVIVIAVIAILSAVLVPTFSSVIESAKKSSAEQRATNAFKEYYSKIVADVNDEIDGTADLEGYIIIVDNGTGLSDYLFRINNKGQLAFVAKVNYTANATPASRTMTDKVRDGADVKVARPNGAVGADLAITELTLEEDYAVEGVDIYYGTDVQGFKQAARP